TRLKELEERLLHAQKMEAIGQLAGGVAHDFNNLLMAIMGYSELVLMKLAENDGVRKEVEEIIRAVERGAGLTRQLLAFSRKQILQPRVLDLNRVLDNMKSMLQRLIGEDIELVFRFHHDLGQVKADPGQIEQVMMNLSINARDAMPAGGSLFIETTNFRLEEQFAQQPPGDYVQMTVSDTGHGMDEATLSRIFEPFFTTKERARGTGLGLSTVYGIVKQSGGYIWASSEKNQGTVFKIYFPRVDAIDQAEQ